MTLRDIIGLRISDIRYAHSYNKEYDFYMFFPYFKLSNGKIISLPYYPDLTYNQYEHYKRNRFKPFWLAKRLNVNSRRLFKKKKIIDIHFLFIDGEFFEGTNSILELENGIFITIPDQGVFSRPIVELVFYNKEQFEDLADDEVELRSINDLMLQKK